MDSQRGGSLPQRDAMSIRSNTSGVQPLTTRKIRNLSLMESVGNPPIVQGFASPTNHLTNKTVNKSRVATSIPQNARRISTLDSPERQQPFDRTFQKTGLSVGVVAGTTRTDPFGFDFYQSPKIDCKYRIGVGNSTNNEKRKNFADLEAKRLSFIPGPKYGQLQDWRNNYKG